MRSLPSAGEVASARPELVADMLVTGRRLRTAPSGGGAGEGCAPREALDEPVVRADTDLLIGRPELQTLAIAAGLSRATFFRAFAGTSGTAKRAKEATP